MVSVTTEQDTMKIQNNIHEFLIIAAKAHSDGPAELSETLANIVTLSIAMLRDVEGNGWVDGFLIAAHADKNNVIKIQEVTVQ